MKKLTKMQQKVYDYIAQFMTKWGYPPSVREICAELNFKSPSTAHFHILNLEKKGYLEHDAGKGRAIRLKGEAQTAPAVPVAPAAPSNAVDFMEERDARENRIPIVGNVAAGSPILAQECVEDYLTFDTGSRSGEFFALRVRGESMLGVGILPDVILRRIPYEIEIRPLEKPYFRQIGLVMKDRSRLTPVVKKFMEYLPFREMAE